MALSHVKTNPVADFTGTVTVLNSAGSTATIAASNLVRPSDWNSAHNFFQTITGATAGQSTASGTDLVMGGRNGIRLELSTAPGVATMWVQKDVQDGFYPPSVMQEAVAGQQGQGTFYMQPMRRVEPFQFDMLALPIIFTATSNLSGSGTFSFWAGVYTQNGSTLSMLHSTSFSTAVTMSGTVGSYSLFGGSRDLVIPWTSTVSEGEYWMGIGSRTTTGGAAMTMSQWLMTNANSSHSGIFGSASASTNQPLLGQGWYTATTSGVPASIAFSQLVGNSSLAQRPPLFYFQSQSA